MYALIRSIIIVAFLVMATNSNAQKVNTNLKNQNKMNNAAILHKANEFVKKGDNEHFLTYCTQNTKWVFTGERVLNGKKEVRQYMKEFYIEPPVFTVDKTIEQGDFVVVQGEITLKSANGIYNHYEYCDVWRFESGKIAELKAYVIEKKLTNK